MTERNVHLSCAPEGRAEIASLGAALSAEGIAVDAAWNDCTLFLACCSAGGAYDGVEVLRAREELRLRPRDQPWIVAVQFGASQIPEPLHGLPLVSLHDDWKRGIARIANLLPRQAPTPSRQEINAINIMAPELLFENRPTDKPLETKVNAGGDIVGDKKITFRNG